MNRDEAGQFAGDSSARIGKVLDGSSKAEDYSSIHSDVVLKIKSLTGLDASDYSHHLNRDAVTHVEKGHKNITADDWKIKLPEIVGNPDRIEKGKTRRGRMRIVYTKRFNGSYYVVEELWTGQKRLSLVTFKKTNASGPHVIAFQQSLGQTSETRRSVS